MKKSLLLMMTLLFMATQGAWALSFITHAWDATKKEVTTTSEELKESDFTQILVGTHPDSWVGLESNGKYLVKSSTYKVLNVLGQNVHLYLCDGVTLNLKHIKLEKGASLHIHAQSEDNPLVGKIIVNNDDYDKAAAIGSANETNAGDLYIHGGIITATGPEDAAGIGGGKNGSCGNVYIYGGTVTATGGKAGAGIGAGWNHGIAEDCSVNIYGGTVNAYGKGKNNWELDYETGAGIGGGFFGSQGGAINIYGGTVHAECSFYGAAGIGGGSWGSGGTVNISGGKVTATGSYSSSGIGPGCYTSCKNSIVNITGGTVEAWGGLAISAKTFIQDAVVITTTETSKKWGQCFNGSLSLGYHMKVNEGTSSTSFNDTPVEYSKFKDACFKEGNYSLKISRCENHHYVNYRCLYCDKEYYDELSDTWWDDGIRASEFSNIDETAKTITITNEAELGLLTHRISRYNGGETYKGYTILLAKDLDMSAHNWDGYGSFYGTFDGQGHTISGLIYHKTNERTAGLIANNYGTIKNVRLANSVIVGNRYVGAITGYNNGIVENCYVGADVSIFASTATEDNESIGGIVGWQNKSSLSNVTTVETRGCYSAASVNGNKYVGGIIGQIDKDTKLTDCVSMATVNCKLSDGKKGILAGLIVEGSTLDNNGYISETVIDNANGTRLISVVTSSELEAGGHKIYYGGTVKNNYNVSGIRDYFIPQVSVGGKLYAKEGGYFTFSLRATKPADPVYTYTHVTVNGTEQEAAGGEYTIETTDHAARYLVDAAAWQGYGTAASPYLIQTTADWNTICRMMNTLAADDLFVGKHFKQTADIDIFQGAGVTGEANNKKFCGTYDGDSHRMNCMLTNPVENSVEAVAPFHDLKNATIKNLIITGSISGGIHSAGITAHTRGTVTIDNCRVSADIICGGSNDADAHGGGFIGHAEDSQVKITKSLFDGSLTAKSNGKGDIRLAAFSGWAGSKIDIQYCAENGKYDGTTANDQTAYCWKDNGNTTPDYDHLNMFISDLGHHNGADKALLVTSGTEDLELVFPDNCYDWQVVYQGAMFRSIDEYAVSYIIGGKFYTILNSVVRFDISYPVNWNNVTVYNGEQKLSYVSGHYNFKQSDKNTVITCEHGIANWIDENVAASKFSTVDESTKTVTIKNAEELALLSKQVYNGENDGEGWTYLLDADLEMSLYEWTPIGTVKDNVPTHYFQGTFDGQGHTISGINVTTNGEHFGSAGLFGCVMAGTVKNVKLFNSQIDGYYYVGGITGYQGNANIENCYVGNNVKLNPLGADASTGGISGVVLGSGSLKGCYSAACISKNEGAQYSYEEINVGGIAGNVNGPAVVTGNVSQAMIMSGTSTQHFRGYVLGSKPYSTATNNYYIASKPSDNSYDVRAFCVTLSEFLEDDGFKMTYQADNTSYDVSGIQMYNGQFLMGDEWYVPANGTFHFSLPESNDIFSRIVWSDVKINDGDVLTPVDGVYSFNITDDTNMEFEVNASYFGTINPPTDITPATTQSTPDDTYYDLNGRKLSGKPTQKGVYIYNGKKVVIK